MYEPEESLRTSGKIQRRRTSVVVVRVLDNRKISIDEVATEMSGNKRLKNGLQPNGKYFIRMES
jgi:hypothetical protein